MGPADDDQCRGESGRPSGEGPVATRRTLLRTLGAATAVPFGAGSLAYAGVRPDEDADGDGIADRDERGVTERVLSDTFGDQFEGLDPTRRDLLLDVRYVEGTGVAPETKRRIEGLFRREGVYAQWLDYPERYDRETFEGRYGSNARSVLWGGRSFYQTEVERALRDVAVQLVVVPGREHPDYGGKVYSPWTDALGGGRNGHVNGFSVGNRAVIADRTKPREEQRLALHEIAHLGLCHDDDPKNRGVMGTGETVDLTDEEWEKLRNSLDNVRDDSGYDVLFRPCLWEECLAGFTK